MTEKLEPVEQISDPAEVRRDALRRAWEMTFVMRYVTLRMARSSAASPSYGRSLGLRPTQPDDGGSR